MGLHCGPLCSEECDQTSIEAQYSRFSTVTTSVTIKWDREESTSTRIAKTKISISLPFVCIKHFHFLFSHSLHPRDSHQEKNDSESDLHCIWITSYYVHVKFFVSVGTWVSLCCSSAKISIIWAVHHRRRIRTDQMIRGGQSKIKI